MNKSTWANGSRVSADFLAAIVESSNDAIFSKDFDGTITSWNEGAERLFGYTAGETVGQSAALVVPEEILPQENAVLQRIRRGEQLARYETAARAKNGARLALSVIASPIHDERGKIIGCSQIAREITDYKRARDAAAILASIIESTSDAVITKNPDGVITSWNRAAERMLGYRAPEIVGQSVFTLIPPERAARERGLMERVLRGEIIEHYETILRHKNGSDIAVSLTISALRDASGKIIGASKIAREIGERLRGQAQLRLSEERFRVTLGSIGDGVISTDAEGRITFLNGVAETLTGWTVREAEGRPLTECFHIINELTRAPVENPVAEVLRRGHTVGLANHTVLIAKGGAERAIDDSAAPIRGRDGRLLGVVLVFRDVTRRREQQATANRLAAIVAHANDGIIAKNLNSIVTAWNRGAERIFGYTAEEMIGQSILRLVPPDRKNEETEIIARLQRGEDVEHFETVRVAKGGRPVDVSLSSSPVRDADGRVIGASKIVRDITQQKKLEATRHYLAALVESSDDAIYSTTLDGLVRSWNEGAERMFGYRREEILGRPIATILPEDLRKGDGDVLARIIRGEHVNLQETRRVRKDGREIQVWVTSSPIRDASGRVVAMSRVARDITRQKQAERDLLAARRQLEEQAHALEEKVRERTARLQESVAELEAFSYSLSHDMRAPLRAIQSFSEIVLQDFGERIGPEGASHLNRVISAAARMDRLIQDVLAFSRVSRQEIELEPVDVEKLVRDILHERPTLQPPKAEISIEGPLRPVMGHIASLTQCLTNLLDNAVKFVPRGVTPRVRIRTEASGAEVRIWIEDNGIGIAPEARSRLFGMFQRLHPRHEYEGTGVGLAIVRRAAERMGGRVGVESEPGRGSRFWVQLPAVKP